MSELDASSAAERRRRSDEAERRTAILEARAALSTEAYSRLEVIIAVFGIAIAVVGIIFGLSTRAVAIAEARESSREMGEKFAAQFADQLERAKVEIEALRGHRVEVQKIALEAKEVISHLKAEQTPSDPGEREKVETAAEAVTHKPPADRTSDDLKSLIVASHISNDWPGVVEHARGLLYLHGSSDRDTEVYALFHLAYALGKIGQREETIPLYHKIVSEFGDDDKYGEFVGNSFVNLANSYCILGNSEKAIEICRQGIEKFLESNDPDIVQVVEYLYYNMACAHARMHNATEAVDALEQMQSVASAVNCEEIRNESDFDPIRDDPAFVRFWQESGCATGDASTDG